MISKKTVLSAAVMMALGSGAAHAAYVPTVTTTGNNFTMLGGTGLLTGGNNDTTFTWDETLRTAVVTDGSYNATLSSPTPFFGKIWTAKNVNIYGPGTYVFDSTALPGDPTPGTGTASQMYTLTIPTGYIGAHMLFDWSTSSDIDVVNLWKLNDSWDATGGDPVGSTTSPDPFCAAPLTTAGCNTVPNPFSNTRYTVWDMVSVDTPASTISTAGGSTTAPDETNLYHGTKMIDGPFVGQSANFNVNVPVPAAVWLLGSGLLGLVGVARRRKKA